MVLTSTLGLVVPQFLDPLGVVKRSLTIFSGYKPQFFFRTTSVTGELTLPEGVEMVMPGDHASLDVSLEKPIALETGSRFAIREGGKTVGSGVVTAVID